jgi:PAS domain S-box-containing protein
MTVGFALHEMIFDEEGRPLDYRFLDANPAYEAITGLKIAQIRGKSVREVLPNIEERWIQTYGRVVLTGEAVYFTDYAEALGKHFDVWAHRPSSGRFIVMVQDASPRVAYKEAARDRERLFQSAIRTTQDGFFVNDFSARIVEVNDAYLRMSGYSREELLGKAIWDLDVLETERESRAHFARIRRTGHDQFETKHRRKNGTLFDVSISVTFLDENGGCMVTFCRDVSERKVAERVSTDLGNKLERALEATHAGLWDWSISEGSISFDGRWAEITGYDLGSEGSFPLDRWRELCHPDDRRRADEALERHLAGQSPRYETRMRIRHCDGHWIWILDRGIVAARDAAGGPARMIGTTVDVSDSVGKELTAVKQASQLRAVLGSVDSAIAFKDRDGRYLGCNAQYERAFGTTQAELVDLSDTDIFDPEEAARIRAEDLEVLATGRPVEPDLIWRKGSSGLERLFERCKLPLAAEDGDPFGIVVLWHDVSESYLSKKADFIQIALVLESENATSRDILEKALEELVSATGSERGFFVCLGETESSVGRRTGPWAECARERVPLIREGVLVAPVIRDKRCAGVMGVAGKARPYNEWDLALSVRVAESAWEVFERKRDQEKGRDIAIQRDLAISAMRAGVETWYIGEGRKEYDERWADILGYTVAELPEDSMSTSRLLTHPDDYQAATGRMLSYLAGESDSYEAELRMRHKDGRWIWVLDRALIVERGSRGEPLRVSGLIIDIDGLKQVEGRLRDALREKDILLKELFHRTKNTMQLINAMLEMKKQGQEASGFNQAIETVQGKIIAMALVQEKLFRNGDLSTLDLGDYITELIELIKDSAPQIPQNVTIRSETMAVPISVDAAVPCGLIVAELISNALAHAFPRGAGGTIDVAVSRDLEGIYLSVQDDGVGLPAGFDIRSTPRLGLKTVVGIGEEQLRGRIIFGKAERGFSCRLSFNDVYYPRRL